MRLVVLLPPVSLATALQAIASPILDRIAAAAPQLAAAADTADASAPGAALASALAELRCVSRYLDGAPPLLTPAGTHHAMLFVLHAAWPVMQPLPRASAGKHPAAFGALCDFYVCAMRAGGAAALLAWLPHVRFGRASTRDAYASARPCQPLNPFACPAAVLQPPIPLRHM
jgi:hypothetical protein